MTQDKLLSIVPLRLTRYLSKAHEENGRFVLKNTHARNYLVVDRTQLAILERFKEPMRVDELVPRLISQRTCPPLRNLYELIVKTEEAGILENTLEPRELPEAKVMPWPFSMHLHMAEGISAACILFGLAGFLFGSPMAMPRTWEELLWGYGGIIVALLFGQFLGACLLRGADCKVYRPRLVWLSPFPHIKLDLDDAIMAGATVRSCIALLQMAPMFLYSGVSAFFYPSLQFLALLGIFWVTLPLSWSPASQLISAGFRQLPLSTQVDFKFIQNRFLWTALHARLQFADKRYILVYGVYSLFWLILFFGLAARLVDVNGVELLQRLYEQRTLRMRDWLVLFFIGIFVIFTVSLAAILIIKNMAEVSTLRRVRKTPHTPRPLRDENDVDAILDTLRASLLFKELDEETLEQVATRMNITEIKRREYAVHQGDFGEYLFVIHQGLMEVLMDGAGGQSFKITELDPSDVFGEIALLSQIPRTKSVRALKPTTLLTLSKADFEELILSRMDLAHIKEIVQKRAFLSRLELCADWHPQAIIRFARLTSFAVYEPGEVVIRDGTDNRFFYLIYEGKLEVRKGKKTLKKLGTGDFFGEISLLRNSLSTADVVCVEPSVCLTVHKTEFLRFMCSDFLVGLQFEQISSKRLRQPVFSNSNTVK